MQEAQGPSSVFQPDEVATITAVYDAVATQHWFTQDDQQRGRFARYIILKFRDGMANPLDLRSHCLEVASERFSVRVPH
ncbi:MAG: hypothetical protein EOP50_22605 [Sphingobacteriales bacterium]|nr:MAG: hypothetical protein EOP50_22605 [Sphingobacteriales bacterium]